MKIFTQITLILLFSISLIACKKNKAIESVSTLDGYWESIGSGWLLHIEDSMQYSMYDITNISCVLTRKAELEELQIDLSLKDDTLCLKRGVMSYKFIRSTTKPVICNVESKRANDPMYNFEVFAETVNEHYAFKQLNAINWSDLYEKQKLKLKNNPTDKQLYDTLEETLEALNDNHAFLEATETFYNTIEETDENEDVDSENQLVEYGDFQVADAVTKHFLVDNLTKDSWLIQWGKMGNNIGFIQIKAMWLYADLHMPESLVKEHGYVDAYVKTFNAMEEGDYMRREVASVYKIMTNVMQDLESTKAIVIDVRFNGGGQDSVSFEILKHFNAKKQEVAHSKLKTKEGFSSVLKLPLDTVDTPYTKPVYIVTSQQTGSAAEAFALASMSLPNFKRIGSSTGGALSTALEKHLPNGWVFSISNEVYMDTNGKAYENIGVPPDINIAYPEDRQTFFRSVMDNLEQDKQTILNAIE